MSSSMPPCSVAPANPALRTIAAGFGPEIQGLETLARSALRMMTAVAEVIQPVVEQIAKKLAHPNTQMYFRRLATDGAAFVKYVEAFPSPGYAPYFVSTGEEPFSSRFYASLVWHSGRLQHQELLDRKEELKAFHRLARRKRWHVSVAQDAERLCRVTHTAISEWFRAARKADQQYEFVSLLEDASAGRISHCDRLFAIASEIAHVVPTAKGRPPRFETSLHAIFLDMSDWLGGRQGYTYTDVMDDYTDDATLATRTELGRPRFNPTAARKVLKRDAAGEGNLTLSSHVTRR